MNNYRLSNDQTTLQHLENASNAFSEYLTAYIETLNKYIGHQRRVSTLRFERATLIKHVKKLRFFNEQLATGDLWQDNRYRNGNLGFVVSSLASFFIRCLEVVDLLNYYLTQALKNETISKTLNNDLVVSDLCIAVIENSYRHYVKYTQWMLEAINLHDPTLTIEVLQFARKCAKEDGLNVEETDDILLQEVDIVGDIHEYRYLLDEWCMVLSVQRQELTRVFELETERWSQVFEPKK
ncbi:LAME_0G17480g1_1 [Lachancea meyersii CBS 8951]|uniref:LAME_0G17480g1_1 n=1 Tax=Lachancea meyersii CBS 8951 TaxID=1266667 RepID=A0A1G4KBF7_9SACH|nr:LAME_0G17480g1_1 [Lachancea meyersii CBS 8951]